MAVEVVTTPWSSDRESDRFAVENPAYGSVLAYVQGAGTDEVDKAVHAAQAGFERWSRRSAVERGTLLLEAARVIRGHADELAEPASGRHRRSS
jgi:acyl-CoA reductase-like NAD-dependent aldehyde dehydrogenase